MTFGENLRNYRQRINWTQEQLGAHVGKSKNNISQYELNKRQPDIGTMRAFARLFHITMDELLGRSDSVLNEPAARRDWLEGEGSVAIACYEGMYPDARDDARPDGWRAVPRALLGTGRHYYCRAQTSFAMKSIVEGDWLLFREESRPRGGEVVLAEMDGRLEMRLCASLSGGQYALIGGDSAEEPRLFRKRCPGCKAVLVRLERDFTPAE